MLNLHETDAPGVSDSPASSLALFGLTLAIVLPPVGLVLSAIALRRTGPGKPGSGLAIAGVVIGGVQTLAVLFFVAARLMAA